MSDILMGLNKFINKEINAFLGLFYIKTIKILLGIKDKPKVSLNNKYLKQAILESNKKTNIYTAFHDVGKAMEDTNKNLTDAYHEVVNDGKKQGN